VPLTAQVFGGHTDGFIKSDPYDGQAFALFRGKPFNASYNRTAWDDIYPSDYIAIENPGRYGLWGGLDLAVEGKSEHDWVGEMGFTLGLLHQLHCVVSKNLNYHGCLNYREADGGLGY
jgi:hypothetical protein